MKSITSKDLLNRDEIGRMSLSSKMDNYEITSIYIKKFKQKNIMEKMGIKFEEKMLKYLSYELFDNDYIILYFDFETCIKELGINVSEGLPIQYLLEIIIIDKDANSNKKEYILSLIIEEIRKINGKYGSVELKKASVPENDDFVLVRPRILFDLIYIVHKYEEDWKKLWISETRKYSGV